LDFVCYAHILRGLLLALMAHIGSSTKGVAGNQHAISLEKSGSFKERSASELPCAAGIEEIVDRPMGAYAIFVRKAY